MLAAVSMIRKFTHLLQLVFIEIVIRKTGFKVAATLTDSTELLRQSIKRESEK
jgi:hypothetical protein